MRALRIVLILLVVLGGLFVGADRLAVGYAEDEAAARIKSARGLEGRPTVEIHGFPFLTQVAGRELESVDLTLDGLTAQVGGREVTITEVDMGLRDVRLIGNLSSAVADRATGTARISYEDLNAAGEEGVVLKYAGPERAAKNQVRIDASLAVLDLTLHSTVSVRDGNTLLLRAEDVPRIPLAEDLLRERTDRELAITGLPSGVELEKIETDEDGVVLSLGGTDVEIAG